MLMTLKIKSILNELMSLPLDMIARCMRKCITIR